MVHVSVTIPTLCVLVLVGILGAFGGLRCLPIRFHDPVQVALSAEFLYRPSWAMQDSK